MSVTHRGTRASTVDGTSFDTAAFTPPSGELLVVFVYASGTVDPGAMVSSTGLTFHRVLSATRVAGANTAYVFVSDGPSTNVSQTLTFSCPGDSATGAVLFVAGVSGMTRFGLAAVRQSAKQDNQLAAATPAPVFEFAALTANPVLGMVANGSNPAALTPPTSGVGGMPVTFTEGGDTGYITPPGGAEYAFVGSGFTDTTVTWGSTSATAWCSLLIEVDTSPPPIPGGSQFMVFF